MRLLFVSAIAATLAFGTGIAGAETVRGKIGKISASMQVITLEDGHAYKLGTYTTSDQVKKGDTVRIDWVGHMKGFRYADRVWVENRR